MFYTLELSCATGLGVLQNKVFTKPFETLFVFVYFSVLSIFYLEFRLLAFESLAYK